mmetsp:Transcript_33271/g.69913  ORF Transcript_33271/g.69913 Transcript_33271/m.69913 type:complete len:200 (-) Transcript_33271:29-628(-)
MEWRGPRVGSLHRPRRALPLVAAVLWSHLPQHLHQPTFQPRAQHPSPLALPAPRPRCSPPVPLPAHRPTHHPQAQLVRLLLLRLLHLLLMCLPAHRQPHHPEAQLVRPLMLRPLHLLLMCLPATRPTHHPQARLASLPIPPLLLYLQKIQHLHQSNFQQASPQPPLRISRQLLQPRLPLASLHLFLPLPHSLLPHLILV